MKLDWGIILFFSNKTCNRVNAPYLTLGVCRFPCSSSKLFNWDYPERRHYRNKAVKMLKHWKPVWSVKLLPVLTDRCLSSIASNVNLKQFFTLHSPESLEIQGLRQEGTSWQIGGEALIYIERRLTSFVRGGELVELLRFKWEQQSKKAVIMVQQQEVTGCESRCVCVFACVGESWHQLSCHGQYQPSYWPHLQQRQHSALSHT